MHSYGGGVKKPARLPLFCINTSVKRSTNRYAKYEASSGIRKRLSSRRVVQQGIQRKTSFENQHTAGPSTPLVPSHHRDPPRAVRWCRRSVTPHTVLGTLRARALRVAVFGKA
ncbi:hypothetical protein GN956_G11490 [Arapaima gigas]